MAGCNAPTCGQEGSCAHRWQPQSLQKKRVLVLGCMEGKGQQQGRQVSIAGTAGCRPPLPLPLPPPQLPERLQLVVRH